MMFLTLDTSMARCSVAVSHSERPYLIAEQAIDMDRGHAEALAPMVAAVLEQAGIQFKDLAFIAVTVGPGTFTGQRIGLSFAKGLGLALQVPVVGIDSLSAIADAYPPTEYPLAVISDARMGQFYFSLFDNNRNVIVSPCLVDLTALMTLLPRGELTLLGTGAAHVLAHAQETSWHLDAHYDLPRASGFLGLAQRQARPAPGPNPHLKPLYLKSADAKPQQQALRALTGVTMRPALLSDLTEMARLHHDCFTSAWDKKALADLLQMAGTMAVVAEHAGELIGFFLMRVAADEAEILTICVAPIWQGRKVGHGLLLELLAGFDGSAIQSVFLEVAEDNQRAIALYASQQFETISTRQNYYGRTGGPSAHALVMRLTRRNE